MDFDGVLIDSQLECLYVSYAAAKGFECPDWKRLSVPRPLRNYFRQYRGWVQPAGEYLALFEGYKNHLRPDSAVQWNRLKEHVRGRMSGFGERFHRLRESFQKSALRRWISLHRAFVKPRAMNRVARRFETRILTTKDERSVKILLSHFKLARFFNRVVGRETIQGDKLAWLARQPCPIPMAYVDDHPEYVRRAAKNGLRAYLASWGYSPPGVRFKGPFLSLPNWDRVLAASLEAR